MINKIVSYSLILVFIPLLGACSVSDSASKHQSSSSRVVPQRVIIKPRIQQPTKVTIKKRPVKVVKPYKPQVRPYVDSKPINPVLKDKETLNAEKAQEEAEYDPYASIPESSSSATAMTSSSTTKSSKISTSGKPTSPKGKSSSAVKSLMRQARAEMIIGKHLSAENKLERALRIEPENSKLWSLMAKAQYGQSNYSQSINMAKKSIRFSSDDDLIAQNWRLIKQAGEKSGDALAVKDALNYSKVNP